MNMVLNPERIVLPSTFKEGTNPAGSKFTAPILGRRLPRNRLTRMGGDFWDFNPGNPPGFLGAEPPWWCLAPPTRGRSPWSSEKGIDIFIGTTAALKALEADSIKLIAIISFDSFINIADFRSAEKTFQMLMYILNSRAMSTPDSKLLIQTFMPSLYILKAVKSKNYNYFYKKELSLRKELNFPPYCRMANIIYRAKREKIAKDLLFQIKNMLIDQKSAYNIEIIGPSAHHTKKVKGYYIWSLILKAKNNITNLNAIKYVIGRIGFRSRRYLTIDMDPR